MSDPQPDRLKPRPRRAQPLQPDMPGRASDSAPSPQPDSDLDIERESLRKLKEQSDTARENNSQGFD